jgi:hypothetical protein
LIVIERRNYILLNSELCNAGYLFRRQSNNNKRNKLNRLQHLNIYHTKDNIHYLANYLLRLIGKLNREAGHQYIE